MNDVHLARPDGSSSVHTEEEVNQMWREGLLSPETQFWKEGMLNWVPLATRYGSALPAHSGPKFPDYAPRYSFARDPAALTSFLLVMLWISAALDGVSILSDLTQLSLLNAAPISPEAAEANDTRQGIVALVALGSFVVTGVAFLKWIHRANLNVRAFGARDLQFTPGWSIGYYFIPFLNLFRPYQAMKEIWKASTDPMNWKMQAGSGLLVSWWTLWIVAGILGRIAMKLSFRAETPEALRDATMASISSSAVNAVLTVVAIMLVREITRRQTALVAA